MQSNNDRVINVPISDEDIVKTVTSLPRNKSNDGYIIVNLKRMMSIKKPYMAEKVQTEQLLEAVEFLRLNHQDYKDVVQSDVIDEFMEDSGENEFPVEDNIQDDPGK